MIYLSKIVTFLANCGKLPDGCLSNQVLIYTSHYITIRSHQIINKSHGLPQVLPHFVGLK